MLNIWLLVFLGILVSTEAQESNYEDGYIISGRSRWRPPWGGGTPPWCPPNTRFCLVNPCDVMTCPAYPQAVCINDDICDRACVGNFYLGRWRLTEWDCQYRRRRRYPWSSRYRFYD